MVWINICLCLRKKGRREAQDCNSLVPSFMLQEIIKELIFRQ
uniref:Uncharacterized protein n=1 Tax=Rhizophora mucronata TaxID=61149 RepID=A0A2P2NKX2_RHIMU